MLKHKKMAIFTKKYISSGWYCMGTFFIIQIILDNFTNFTISTSNRIGFVFLLICIFIDMKWGE